MKWFIKCLKLYADFSGRAQRKEYWMFTLFYVIFLFAWLVLISGFSAGLGEQGQQTAISVAWWTYNLVFLIPSLAVGVRRLHDIGKSGWWMLFALIPYIGWIVLFVFFVIDSEWGSNKYGDNLKGIENNANSPTKPLRKGHKKVKNMGLFDFLKKEQRSIEPAMGDWSSLLRIIQKEKNKSVRIEAIKKLHHPLVEGSGNLSDIYKINDQDLLKEIYFNNIYYQDLRVAVINQIKDQSILAEIAKTIYDNERVLRDTVLAKLSEQTALTEVVMNARSVEMRKEVINQRLTDQSALNHIARHNDNDDILKYAIRFILDENVLVELVDFYINKNKSSEIQKSAKERLEQLRKEKYQSPKEIISKCLVGDRIAFGKWKGNPLYWIVLSVQDDKLLLITKECLENKPFNLSGEATWDNCSLRSELNGDYFYNNSSIFNDNERKSILKTTTDSPSVYYQNKRTWEELFGKKGNDTQNYVFLLDVGEACKYFNVTGKGMMRDYNGYEAFEFPQGESLSAEKPWWLRTSTRKGAAAVNVITDGMINFNGFTVSENFTVYVRPAIWISK